MARTSLRAAALLGPWLLATCAASAEPAAQDPGASPEAKAHVRALAGADATAHAGATQALIALGRPALPLLADARRDADETGRGRLDAVAREIEKQTVRALTDELFQKVDRSRREIVLGPALAAEPARLDVEWESGSGHGGTLHLLRLRRTAEGAVVDRIGVNEYANRNHALWSLEANGPWIERAAVTAGAADALCGLLLRAATIEWQAIPQPEGSRRGGSMSWSSSRDFTARVVVRDEDRTVFEDRCTAYSGTLVQQQHAPLLACNHLMADFVRELTWEKRAVAEEDRAFLHGRAGSLAQDGWWVGRRVLAIVREIGDARFEPILRRLIQEPPLRADGERQPWLEPAIHAYAGLTGVDLRPTPFDEKALEEVRERYLDYFGR